MIIKAEQKNQRQTARKTRLVSEAVKKMSIEQAIRQLAVMDRRASLPVLKVLRQAIANATNNHGLSLDQLVIADIVVNEGPTYKRWRAVSRGRAHTILKRTCHIKVELKTKEIATEAIKAETKVEVAEQAPKKAVSKKVAPEPKEVKKALVKKTAKTSKTASKKAATVSKKK